MEIIKLLEDTKHKTLEHFELSESDLRTTYGEGKWNIHQILVHLADAESVLYERIRRIIAEPRQVLWNFDQDAWAENLNYKAYPLALSKNLFTAVRDNMIYLATQHYEKLGTKEFVHSDTGVRTLKEEFDKVASHNQHHLRHIEAALKKAQ
ncbi:DinB family protein [Catalinimonas sp. 4WD22]|uniref:DinB family protein n=1 Tax=Catalinimonas locisalis TaxID=3133978 RepID=UPI0031019576